MTAPWWCWPRDGAAAISNGGYPSTVQMADGTLLTAYYSNRVPQHQRYHMGAVRWVLEKE